MTVEQLLRQLANNPEQVDFNQVIAVIDANYDYQPASFSNGDVSNAAGSNEGSCKIFAFARLNELDAAQTLACFGNYYREDVLQHPDADDHANIRNFMQSGWDGIHFDSVALSHRPPA